jgi:superfamily I DNA and/or RNA helicase
VAGDLSDALAELSRLLDLEAAESRARLEEALAERSEAEKEASGWLLRKAPILEEEGALFGRFKLVLGEDENRRGHLRHFSVRPGSPVEIVREDAEEGGAPQRGIVTRFRPHRLEVVFEANPELSKDRVTLTQTADDVTVHRMQESLRRAGEAKGRSAHLVGMLLGLEDARPLGDTQIQFEDQALNADQRAAATIGVYAPDLALIHGPFGTGKTRVLVEVIRQCVARGEKVLCLCATNAAVDHLALEVLRADPNLPLARTGHPARSHPLLEDHTLAALTHHHERRKLARQLVKEALQHLDRARKRKDRGRAAYSEIREARVEAGRLFADARRLERQASDEVLRKTKIVCGTLTGFERELPSDLDFESLVVDEASQAITPALLSGLLRANRVVLAGDHKQLPPTVISKEAEAGGLSKTAFDLRITEGHPSHMLTVQHRMSSELMAFPSARFYEDKLSAHDSVAEIQLENAKAFEPGLILAERCLDVIDTAGAGMDEEGAQKGTSLENPEQAALCARLVRALIAGGLAEKDLGVITPYAAQVAAIGRLLGDEVDAGLEVDSVDGFQGREKEVIVVDAVRSNARGEVGFLADARRLNVALTRCRRHLVVIGDSATLSSDAHWQALFDHAIATERYRSVFELPAQNG